MAEFDASKWIFTENPTIFFENTAVGRCKKEVWDMSMDELDRILKEDYEIPSPSEMAKAGCYIQTTPRGEQIEKRRKCDIVLVPVSTTENHGMHLPTGQDTFQVTQFLEGIRRHQHKLGRDINLAWCPLLYGGHPYHHIGMPGTYITPESVVVENLVSMMLGLWDDGYRKIILVNNHGQLWMLVTAIHEFCKRYQLPGIFQVFDWHRSVREFFAPNNGKENSYDTNFNHACEAETSLGLLMFPEMVDMSRAVDTKPVNNIELGWFDNSTDDFHRPHRWDEGEGHAMIERFGTPEGVVGTPTHATADKAKRPIVAICRLLELLIDDIATRYPAGTVPEGVSLRSKEELAPFLKEPMSEGWKSVWELPRMGPAEHI